MYAPYIEFIDVSSFRQDWNTYEDILYMGDSFCAIQNAPQKQPIPSASQQLIANLSILILQRSANTRNTQMLHELLTHTLR